MKKAILVGIITFRLNASTVMALIEFKDGQIHDIDYEIRYDAVWVDYQSPGVGTTLNLIGGGGIPAAALRGYQDSYINIDGGSTNGLYAYDRTTVTFSAGSCYSSLTALNDAQVNLSGGFIDGFSAQNDSYIDMSGGTIEQWLKAGDNSEIIITDGEVLVAMEAAGNSQVTISGGTIGGAAETCLLTRGDGSVNILDGTISRNLEVQNNSRITISGGQIAGENDFIVASDYTDVTATLTLIGSDFTVDGQPVGYGELTSILEGDWRDEPWRHVAGILNSGDVIDNDFKIGYQGRIVLTPELATLLLLGLGVPILSGLRRRR